MPWRCSSLMMRRSVQAFSCFGLSAFALLAAGLLVAADAAVVVVAAGAVAAAGAGAATAGGRSTYFGASTAGATSLTCVAVVVACEAGACSLAADIDRLRSAAWADADARTKAATRMILRMRNLPVFA